jgi:hypothetical protein
MSVQTDQTLADWSRAATALGAETSVQILAAVHKVARAIGASADAEADAMPHVFLAVWRNGVSIEQASHQAVMSKHRTEQTKSADPDFVSLDDVETQAERDALEVAMMSSRDEVARSYDGGSRGEILPLADALALAPHGAASIVSAVIADAAKHSATRDYNGALYVPLKVTVIATAAGVSRPRTKQASTELRKAGCTAYAMVQALRDDSETVETLTSSALAWVTRDRRAYGGHGLAVWNNGARPEGIEYATYRPMSDFQPDINTGSHVAPLQPVRGHRVNTGSKGRQGPTPGQPLEGISHGASGSQTPGTLFSATGGPNDAGLAAKRSVRADDAALTAHEASDARSQATACKRPIESPDNILTSRLWGEHKATCGCGPTVGKPLIERTAHRVMGRIGQSDIIETWHYWTHALTLCPMPAMGAHGLRCGCGRKRGALTDVGEHRAR